MKEIKKRREWIFSILVFITIILLINDTFFSFSFLYFSFFPAIISLLNLISYFVYGYIIYLIQKHILKPEKSIEKLNTTGKKLILLGSFNIFANILYLIYGLNKPFPEAELLFFVVFNILSIPLYLNTILFTTYGIHLTLNTMRDPDFRILINSENIALKIRTRIHKIRRTTFIKILKIQALLSIIFSLSMIGNNTVLKRIYYTEIYEVYADVPDTIVDLVETLEYQSLIQYHGANGEVYNITSTTHLNLHYFDRDYIEFLKQLLRSDSMRFHWWSGHRHYFHYYLKITEEAKIYFTYDNNTIIEAQYESYEDIFVVRRLYGALRRSGNWYVNYSQIPFVANVTTISLNNTFLVKMRLKYDYLYGTLGGEFFEVNQFLVLDSHFRVILIFIPHFQLMVA
jgi:hypothetical protein